MPERYRCPDCGEGYTSHTELRVHLNQSSCTAFDADRIEVATDE